MTTKLRSLRNFRNPIGCLILLAALGAAAGCSTAESPGGSATNMNHVLPSGSSVPGWLVVPSGGSHASTATLDYIANGGSSGCSECHGSDLSGGISNVSCFSNTAAGCHHVTAAGAPAWGNPLAHGAAAKKAPGSSGFASCQICHGNNFSGGGAGVACVFCHGIPAPHPESWRIGSGATTFLHITTHQSNAPVCAQCHRDNNLNPDPSLNPTPAPPGTAPGCFNNTMCHGQIAHPDDWALASQHGSFAKALPSASSGFAYCQTCHGTGTTSPENFGGGTSEVSCYTCHLVGVNVPHPEGATWRGNLTPTHRNTNQGQSNVDVCAQCHRSAPGTAGCFNNTLCHGN